MGTCKGDLLTVGPGFRFFLPVFLLTVFLFTVFFTVGSTNNGDFGWALIAGSLGTTDPAKAAAPARTALPRG